MRRHSGRSTYPGWQRVILCIAKMKRYDQNRGSDGDRRHAHHAKEVDGDHWNGRGTGRHDVRDEQTEGDDRQKDGNL